jgi:AraC-like DNA-binding protein
MRFQRFQPSTEFSRFVECYWMIEDQGQMPSTQKIVPDGYPEIIFHLADAYRINISGQWELQTKSLLAGQIKKFFFLENIGQSSVFGVKLKPAAPTLLFGVEMSRLTDCVVDLHEFNIPDARNWEKEIAKASSLGERVVATENFLLPIISSCDAKLHPVERALETVFSQNGTSGVEQLAEAIGVGTRQLELYFKKYVGLSPKFYSRIIRFSRIFEWIQQENVNWSDIVHLAGYYDQAHFIKNFKTFTGEEPSRYGFDKRDFANFFMKKKV